MINDKLKVILPERCINSKCVLCTKENIKMYNDNSKNKYD